jgi:hypothetical protein
MRLVTFADADRERLGALVDQDQVIVDLAAGDPDYPPFASMLALIDAGAEGLDRARSLVEARPAGADVERAAVALRVPLHPRRIRGAPIMDPEQHLRRAVVVMARRMAGADEDPGVYLPRLNAMIDRVVEFGPLATEMRDHLCITGPEEVVTAPSYCRHLDYELELACIIGKRGSEVPADAAADHIFGYTIFNDWSARDEQVARVKRGLSWGGAAKEFDGSTGIGPCIVTADELKDPYNLVMTARVDGEEWSRGTSAEHVRTFEECIASMSRGVSVVPGELLCSGTVGTGCGLELDRYLSDGAVVELEVEGIGVLRNSVRVGSGR